MPEFATPAFHRDNLEIAIDLEVVVEHLREFADGHSVASRQWELSDERSVFGLKNVSGHLEAVNRIRSIANDYSLVESLRSTHAVRKCVNKCVDATTDVLHVEHERIDVRQHRFRWFPCLAVKRM